MRSLLMASDEMIRKRKLTCLKSLEFTQKVPDLNRALFKKSEQCDEGELFCRLCMVCADQFSWPNLFRKVVILTRIRVSSLILNQDLKSLFSVYLE